MRQEVRVTDIKMIRIIHYLSQKKIINNRYDNQTIHQIKAIRGNRLDDVLETRVCRGSWFYYISISVLN